MTRNKRLIPSIVVPGSYNPTGLHPMYMSRTYSDQSLNMLVGPGVESRVQLAAIDCRSVACVLGGRKHQVTRVRPTDPRVSTKSGVSGVFPEWFQEVRSSRELRSYNQVREVRRSESQRDSARQAKPEAKWRRESSRSR